jgi:hypothetical protein
MAAPRFLSDLAGTLRSAFRIGVNRLANDAGNSNVLTSQTAAGADAPIAASEVHLNAANTAFKVALKSPDALGASSTLTLPAGVGAANQALVTDGATGALSWATVATGANTVYSEDTVITWETGAAAVPVKSIPAGATVQKVMVQVDTTFDGGTPVPNLSVGKNGGSASAYMTTTDNDLTVAGEFEVSCMVEEPAGATVEVSFVAATSPSPSQGTAVVTVWWSVPG